jgi:hypothetical protein
MKKKSCYEKILLFCVWILLATGCSELGSRTRFEAVHSSPKWTHLSTTGRFDVFNMCDTTGFVAVGLYQNTYSSFIGPVLIPIFPMLLFKRQWPPKYRVFVTVQPLNGIDSLCLVQDHFLVAFNSSEHIVRPRVVGAYPCAEEEIPSCYDNTVREHRINSCVTLILEFPIHPDSVETIFVKFNEEFTRRTGLPNTTLRLDRYNQLYYKPFLFDPS